MMAILFNVSIFPPFTHSITRIIGTSSLLSGIPFRVCSLSVVFSMTGGILAHLRLEILGHGSITIKDPSSGSSISDILGPNDIFVRRLVVRSYIISNFEFNGI